MLTFIKILGRDIVRIHIHDSTESMAQSAAAEGIATIQAALAERGEANVILATGASQFGVLEVLVKSDIDFSKVRAFHLDEYIGLPLSHPASFRRYLTERVIAKVPAFKEFTLIDGEAADIDAEIARVSALIAQSPIDVCFAGIGENGHLAFNDPPADFETEAPYINVELDAACRQQQYGEGWFESLDAVPRRAVSMSVRQILKSKSIILTVPDTRKAAAVARCLEGPVDIMAPASIVQTHASTSVHLDKAAASKLKSTTTV
ncbi:MAG: glucosamine-6-phosphate deaminase [Devosia marina]|uniref:glucosamine-6-phosphate deaminase n=1 Tax=Devosia marina TaxID=2683198 RepID=UPI0032ED227C